MDILCVKEHIAEKLLDAFSWNDSDLLEKYENFFFSFINRKITRFEGSINHPTLALPKQESIQIRFTKILRKKVNLSFSLVILFVR